METEVIRLGEERDIRWVRADRSSDAIWACSLRITRDRIAPSVWDSIEVKGFPSGWLYYFFDPSAPPPISDSECLLLRTIRNCVTRCSQYLSSSFLSFSVLFLGVQSINASSNREGRLAGDEKQGRVECCQPRIGVCLQCPHFTLDFICKVAFHMDAIQGFIRQIDSMPVARDLDEMGTKGPVCHLTK